MNDRNDLHLEPGAGAPIAWLIAFVIIVGLAVCMGVTIAAAVMP